MAFIELCPLVCTDQVLCLCSDPPQPPWLCVCRLQPRQGTGRAPCDPRREHPFHNRNHRLSFAGWDAFSHFLVDFVLEYIQVIGGSHSNNVVVGVPSRVQNLLIEVQTIHTDLVLLPLPAWTHSPRLQTGSRLAVLSGSFQGHVPPRVSVKHPEEVVVGPCHDSTVQTEREARVKPAGTWHPATALNPAQDKPCGHWYSCTT